jgi:Carbon-nitrogen hydrolase
MSKVRIATCVPRQYWMQAEKLAWLDKALDENACDLFVSPQEFFGGGSTREMCRRAGFKTDDRPVTEGWLNEHIGDLARKHKTCIGIGASVKRRNKITEDFLYYSRKGELLGYHSKLALPAEDSVLLKGASEITPETNYERAFTPIDIPELGIRVGTVFCWQVFFVDFWAHLMRQGCSLVVHPIKFAPRAWYDKGETLEGEKTRIGYKQDKGSDDPSSDALGWLRKLKYESEFKQLPIAISCNTWDGGEQYLALVGWVDEVTHKTELFHLPSTAKTEKVVVTEYDPELIDALPKWSKGNYGQFKDDYNVVMQKTMMRKSIRSEQRAQDGRTVMKLEKLYVAKAVEKATLVGKRQNADAGLSSFFDNF